MISEPLSLPEAPAQQEEHRDPVVQHPVQRRPHIVNGFGLFLLKRRFRLHLLSLLFGRYGITLKVIRVLRKLLRYRKLIHGNESVKKWVWASGKYYFSPYANGFPDPKFDRMILQETERIDDPEKAGIRFAFFGISKRCPMRCEHCFEWDNIHQKELLSYDDMRLITRKLIDAGITQLHLSGGEPMLRVEEIVRLAEEFSPQIDIWIITAGWNGSRENILKLKAAGITGFVVSLDHYEAMAHDRFRGFSGAYTKALLTIGHARNAGLPVTLSVCVTRDFCERKHLEEYLRLAKYLDVSFIQLLEPKAVGHYAGKDVLLRPEHMEILETFFREVNREKKYRTYPVIIYHGYHQRKAGCHTAGNRALYIDTNGEAMSCPFCHHSSGNLLKEDAAKIIRSMRSKGCSTYGTASF